MVVANVSLGFPIVVVPGGGNDSFPRAHSSVVIRCGDLCVQLSKLVCEECVGETGENGGDG